MPGKLSHRNFRKYPEAEQSQAIKNSHIKLGKNSSDNKSRKYFQVINNWLLIED